MNVRIPGYALSVVHPAAQISFDIGVQANVPGVPSVPPLQPVPDLQPLQPLQPVQPLPGGGGSGGGGGIGFGVSFGPMAAPAAPAAPEAPAAPAAPAAPSPPYGYSTGGQMTGIQNPPVLYTPPRSRAGSALLVVGALAAVGLIVWGATRSES